MAEQGKAKKLFCFGFGYTADYLALECFKQGWRVCGTYRDEEIRESLKEKNVFPFLFDFDHPLSEPADVLHDVTHILLSIPPDAAGDVVYRLHGIDLEMLPNLEWVGYLSSASVYGDWNGEWVKETAEPRPSSRRGSLRLKAENQWLDMFAEMGLPVHIFRLAGIYGPGRNAIETVQAGFARRIEKQGQYFSRTHVDDLVQTLIASMNNPAPGNIYNVSDDEPVPSHEVIKYACELLGLEPPPIIPFEQADLAPMAASFYKDNKRVANQKIKDELGVQLKYPDFRSGLNQCFSQMAEPA